MDNISIPPRVVVVLEPHPESARVLRAAKRRAENENLDWEVLLIETPRIHRRLSPQSREMLLNLTTLAEQMGGIVKKTYAPTMLKGIVDYVEQCRKEGILIYSIKLADIQKPYLFPFYRSLWKKLNLHFGDRIRISTVPVGINQPTRRFFKEWISFKKQDVIFSIAIVVASVLFIEVARHIIPEAFNAQHRNKTMVLLIACTISALRHGFIGGLITSTLGFLALNFFYYAPTYSLRIDDSTEALTLILFLAGGIIVSVFGNKNYGNRLELAKRSDRFSALLSVHRLVLNKNTQAEAIATLDKELKKTLQTDVIFLMPSASDVKMLEPPLADRVIFNDNEKKALDVCWMENKTTGVGAPYQPQGCAWRFEPMSTSQKEIGVLCVRINDRIELDEDFGRLLSGIADQAALILERLEVEREMEDNKVQAEREKLRAMLLSSVSHDLKTPLASVIGSLSVFRSMGTKLPEEHRITLIDTALDEAQRLDSFITNILDMTRIETGQIEMREEWANPATLVDEIVRRLRDRLRNHPVNIHPSSEVIEAMMDPMMTGQVIQNLLDNAAKYTRAGTAIDVSWQMKEDKFIFTVRDHGQGIPEDQLEKVFDKYARIKKQDTQVAGTGLGLAISRAVIQAQGGTVRAYNHPEGGAVFEIKLPNVRVLGKQEAA